MMMMKRMKRMKRVLLVGLVVGVLLCIFGGVAVADAYEVEELGLTFELEGDWEIYTGETAQQYYDGFAAPNAQFANGICYFAAMQIHDSSQTPNRGSFIFIATLPNEDTAGVVSYRALPEAILNNARTLAEDIAVDNGGEREQGYLLYGEDALFAVTEIMDSKSNRMLASTIEQSAMQLIYGYGDTLSPTAFGQIQDMLASCAFTQPVPLATPVTDPYAWCQAFETLYPQYFYVPASQKEGLSDVPPFFVRTAYITPSGLVMLLGEGENPFLVVGLYGFWNDEEDRPLVRDTFLRASALSMMVSAGQTQPDDFVANMLLLDELLQQLEKTSNSSTQTFYVWNNMVIGVGMDLEMLQYVLTIQLYPE
ncbi:MAG: hypothetical protein LBM74_08755 [Oscillospiraceae bacterium]|jgi:hypothetical protein|nr:hypothetical protein [Oscillospiraceae bacterium]